MKPFVKYRGIQRHSGQYPVSVMCQFFGISRSGYYDFLKRKDHPDKDAPIAEMIAEQQEKCFHTYGYRRMWKVLKKKDIIRNPKTILRIMKKYDLLRETRRRRKWVQMGKQLHKYENLLNREFSADAPNRKSLQSCNSTVTKAFNIRPTDISS